MKAQRPPLWTRSSMLAVSGAVASFGWAKASAMGDPWLALLCTAFLASALVSIALLPPRQT